MFPRKYLPLLLMMLPFISGFSDHWLRAERPWKKWPLQPKVAFSADVIFAHRLRLEQRQDILLSSGSIERRNFLSRSNAGGRFESGQR